MLSLCVAISKASAWFVFTETNYCSMATTGSVHYTRCDRRIRDDLSGGMHRFCHTSCDFQVLLLTLEWHTQKKRRRVLVNTVHQLPVTQVRDVTNKQTDRHRKHTCDMSCMEVSETWLARQQCQNIKLHRMHPTASHVTASVTDAAAEKSQHSTTRSKREWATSGCPRQCDT